MSETAATRPRLDEETAEVIRRRAAVARVVGIALAGAAMAVALGCLVGWYTRTDLLFTWGGPTTTKANTAAATILAGVALLAIAFNRRRVAAVAALVPLALGLVLFVERFTDLSFGIDEILVDDYTVTGSTRIGGRPALESIVLMVGTGLTLLILSIRPQWATLVSRLTVVLELVLLVCFIQQIGGGTTLFPVAESAGIAYPTTAQFILLVGAVQCLIADRAGQVFHTWIDTSLRARVLLAMTLPLAIAVGIPAIGIAVELRHGEQSDAILLARLWGLSMVALFTLFWVFTKMLSGSVVSRLDNLVANADIIKSGRFDTTIDTSGRDEISRLARQFDSMRIALRDRMEEEDLRKRVAHVVSQAEDLQSAFEAFGDEVYEHFHWDRATYFVPDDHDVTIAATHGPAAAPDAIAGGPSRPARMVGADSVRAADEPVLVRHMDPEFAEAFAPVKSFMYCPIVIANEVRAAVSASSFEPDKFDEADLKLFASLVAKVAGTFHHLHLLEREKEGVRRLTVLDELRSEFIAMVAHDLRLPMSVIWNTVEMLRTDWKTLSDNERESYLRRLSDRMRGTSRFVDDMLRVVRIESGDLSSERKPFDLAAVVRAVVNDFVHHQSPRPFRIDIDEDLPRARGDERSQWQLLGNLLANACKYSDEDQPVEVSVHRSDGMLKVSVADHGVGIAPEDKESVFEKFSRGVQGSASLKVAGSGLGLYICRRLVETEGGEIWVDSTPGEGSTFSYTVPVAGED